MLKFVPSPYGLKPPFSVSGAPELTLKTPPSCHASTTRCTMDGALASKGRFGPNGNSHVPLLRMSCVRLNVMRLFIDWFRGSTQLVPKDLLQVYVVGF